VKGPGNFLTLLVCWVSAVFTVWHPNAVEVWVGWIGAVSHLPDAAEACQAVLARGLQSLSSPADTEALYAASIKAIGHSLPAGRGEM